MGKRTQILVAVVAGAMFLPSLVVSASAAVSVGHSGWTWGNPSPQGNEIRGLEFIGDRGYAAGTFGTLLRTDDAGSTWAGLPTGITQDLSRVRIIDSDSLVIAGGCAVRRSDNAGQSFERLPWTASDSTCPSPVVSLSFPSDQTGYLLIANGTVLRTADGGKTWARRTAVPGTPVTGATPSGGGSISPTDIFFTGVDTGAAVTAGGRIYRTTDGGSSWTLVLTLSKAIHGLHFVDSSTGFAVGSGVLFKSTDGGASWIEKLPGPFGNLDIRSIRCANANTCLATVEAGDRVLRTTDGGDSFASVTPSTEKIFAAAFASGTRAIAAGALGTTVVSNDAAATWAAIGARLSDDFSRLRATSSSLAFAVGENGALARTTDLGLNWTSLGVSTSSNVLDTSFPNENTGYALDAAGSVLRTDNGGTSWKILNTGTTAKPNALLALDPSRILLIGPRGVRRSTDGGGEFGLVRGRAVRKASLFDFDRAGRTLFAFGFEALFVSTDTGKNWKRVPRPARRFPRSGLAAVDFVNARRGFALSLDGRLWQTRNRGRRWQELPGIGNDSAFELAFSNGRTGYAAVRQVGGSFDGYVLRTGDAGRTWQPQLVDAEGIDQHGLVATGGTTALLLSLDNGLFATTSGGEFGKQTALTLRAERHKLRKPATIKVTGKLSPAEGGEQVVVSMRGARLVRWRRQVVTVASDGSFTTSWKVKNTSYFVAQWSGDDDRRGDGSRLLTVKVR